MRAKRVRMQTMFIAIAAIAVLFAFFRPQANEDPVILSVVYGAFIVGILVHSVVYAIGLLDFTAPHLKESQSSTLEAGFEPKRGNRRVKSTPGREREESDLKKKPAVNWFDDL